MASAQSATCADGYLCRTCGSHWFGFTATNIPEGVQDSLLNIVMVGMGSYVMGRSGENASQPDVSIVDSTSAGETRPLIV